MAPIMLQERYTHWDAKESKKSWPVYTLLNIFLSQMLVSF